MHKSEDDPKNEEDPNIRRQPKTNDLTNEDDLKVHVLKIIILM